MEKFVNLPAANWAKQQLSQPVRVEMRQFKVVLGICFAVLGLIAVPMALMFYGSAISMLINVGLTQSVIKGLVGGTVVLVVFVALVVGLLLFGRFSRAKFASVLSADGVKTQGGKTFAWSDLHYLDHKRIVTGPNRHQPAVSAVHSAILADVEKVTVEMVLANGKAVIPPLVIDQKNILGLLDGMPVQRRRDGAVVQ